MTNPQPKPKEEIMKEFDEKFPRDHSLFVAGKVGVESFLLFVIEATEARVRGEIIEKIKGMTVIDKELYLNDIIHFTNEGYNQAIKDIIKTLTQ